MAKPRCVVIYVLLLLCIIIISFVDLAFAALPQPPSSLLVTPGNTELTLTWTRAKGADTYVIYRSTTIDGTYGFVGRTKVNCFSDVNLTNGLPYFYTITSVNDDGESQHSGPISATPLSSVLEAPQNLKTSPGNEEVSIVWDPVTSAVNYNVIRISAGGQITVLTPPAPGTSYTDRNVTNGSTYYYAVQTMSTNPGAYSYTVAAQPSELLPKAPANVSTDPGSEWAEIMWSSVEDVSRYVIYRGTSVGGPFEFRGTTENLSFTDTKLIDGQNYYYTITAVNENGQSALSPVALADVSLLNKPQIPIVAGYTNWYRVYLDWPNAYGAVSYSIFRSTTQGVYDYNAPIETTNVSYYHDGDTEYGTTYYYTVRANNASPFTSFSTEVHFTPLESRPAPQADSIHVIPGNTQVTVRFDPVDGVKNYKIEICETDGGPPIATGAVSYEPSYTAKELTNGTTYYFRVGSSVGATTSYSDYFPGTPQSSLPLATSEIRGEAGNRQVSIRWDTIPGAINYKVYRTTEYGPLEQVSEPDLDEPYFQDNSLTNGTTYCYNIAGVNGAGEGAWATYCLPLTPSEMKNLATSNIESLAGNTHAGVRWDPIIGAARYLVEIASEPGGEMLARSIVDKPYHTFTELTNGMDYFVRVMSYYDNSSFSEDIQVIPSVNKPMAISTDIGTIWQYAGNSQSSLRWTQVDNATNYNIYRYKETDTDPPELIANVEYPIFLDTNLDNGTKYFYAISAVNDSGEGPLTPRRLESTSTARRNIVPTNLVAKPGNTQLTALWENVTGATGYRIAISTIPGGGSSDPWESTYNGRTSATKYGLTNGEPYYVRVQTMSPTYSAEYGVAVVTPSELLPFAPENLTCVAPGNTANTIDWNDVEGATGYTIYRRVEGNADTNSAVDSSTYSIYNDTGLVNEKQHYYLISAYNGAGEGALSRTERYCTPTSANPQAPTNIKAISGDGEVSLSWQGSPGDQYYLVRRSESPGGPFDSQVIATEPSKIITGLDNGTLYYFRVQAQNDDYDFSAYSSQSFAIPTATITDSDLDGIPDDWEEAFFGSITIAGSGTDYDGDLYSDAREYNNWRSNILDPAGNQFDPLTINAPWGVGYDGSATSEGILNLVLPTIISNAKRSN